MKFAKIVGIPLAFLACFAFGFTWRDLQKGAPPSTDALRVLLGASRVSKEEVSATQTFRAAYQRISTDYYKGVDGKKLKYAGIEGLMGALGDPHTVFMEPAQAKEFQVETQANFVGIGARLSPDPMGARVASVFEDGPANRAGLRVGDSISGVDGESVVGKTVEFIVSKIRGKEGTPVRLQIVRPGAPKPLELSIRRSQVITPTVEGKLLPGSIGYVAVASFSEPTNAQFSKELGKLGPGLKGLIIDVRNNPGGLLETAVEMLSRYADDKVVVKMRMRDGREEVAKTYYGQRKPLGYPVIVLVNEESASAAEIFAGALRDYKLATLVGEHTYGKASVQNVYALVDGSNAKITIARYFLPSGQDISRRVDEDGQYVSGGLQPDYKVELDLTTQVVFGDPDKDPQLKKAIEIIQSKE
ncbi:MAG: S41 family peptidase [Fimbriimonadaceae bacterium]|nr:S41 family peptidase [Chthonomonadaceae bacterium]MCO5296012.1 S41 family peptidase [Fimbriimonadaceae bacterium]